MDKAVPTGAALLLDFIMSIEAPRGFDTIYGNNQGKLPKPLTSMTLGDVINAQKSWTRRFKSSACGGFQFMRDTLIDLSKELHLSGSLLFDAELQTALGYHLLKRRGYTAFMAGKMSRTEFGKRLAQEWASFPVLVATQGAKRKVRRGESYYQGDALNSSLVSAARVEAKLDEVKATGKAAAPVQVPEDRSIDEPASARTDSVTVEVVQRKLYDLGYTEVGSRDPKTGSFDGKLGKMTRTAILAFRNENGLPAGDAIDDALLAAIDTAMPRALARNNTPAEEVRQTVPEVRSNWMMKIGAIIAAIPAAIGGFFDGVIGNLGVARATIDQVKGYAADVPGWVWLGAIVLIAGGVYLVARNGEQKGVQAYQEGARR